MYSDASLLSGLIAGFIVLWVIISIGIYILIACAFYKMFKKSGVHHPWLAFIPIANMWPYLWTVGKSAWNVLWLLVPIANVVFAILWQYRLYRSFGVSPWFLLMYIGCAIPGISLVVSLGFLVITCYMGFSSVRYEPYFENRYSNLA